MNYTLLSEKNALIDEFNDDVQQINALRNQIVDYLEEAASAVMDIAIYTKMMQTNKKITDKLDEVRTLITKLKRKRQLEKIYNTLNEITDLKGWFIMYFEQLKESVQDYKKQQRFKQYQKENVDVVPSNTLTDYFDECNTKKDLMRKYKKLVKKYHPDNGGDALIFVEINQQYEKKKGELS